jgi:pantoate--beta-alanine ligase
MKVIKGGRKHNIPSYMHVMKTVKSIQQMQKLSARLSAAGKTIALVPTMGALHEGHLSLVRRARKLGDITIVSIYVNPAQFGPGEDLGKYPRTLPEDKSKLRNLKVDYLFLPTNKIIYPDGYETYINLEKISQKLEGKSRPTHFRGVATIVAKLFNIVQPDIAVFGQKDFQQSALIKKLVRDLNIPIKIVVGPTVREKSGLAMSSRNKYFNPEQKVRAAVLYNSLRLARQMISEGERESAKIKRAMRKFINRTPGTRIDYIAITDNIKLDPLKKASGKFTISLAVWLDEVRLIDNINFDLKS